MSKKPSADDLSQFIPASAIKLLTAKGIDFIQQTGHDVVRGVVLDVLVGKNLRYSTEVLTRRRLAALNLVMVNLFLQGMAKQTDFVEKLPYLATKILTAKALTKMDRWIAQWMLGLTDKAFQNVLRDNPKALAEYRDRYIEACREAIANHAVEHGELSGFLELPTGVRAKVNWLMLAYLLNTVGAQTLAVRGSEKSSYGKLFEKLVLGSLLHTLGFKQVPPNQPQGRPRVFWLASRGERRESDATLLYEAGKGVRFDIGFIGRGNPEISLDKVTRFERETQIGGSRWYMATIIIIDRIGQNSRIEKLARKVGGTIVQMSAAYWPQQVARELKKVLGFDHELVRMPPAKIEPFLRNKLQEMPFQDFVGAGNQNLS